MCVCSPVACVPGDNAIWSHLVYLNEHSSVNVMSDGQRYKNIHSLGAMYNNMEDLVL